MWINNSVPRIGTTSSPSLRHVRRQRGGRDFRFSSKSKRFWHQHSSCRKPAHPTMRAASARLACCWRPAHRQHWTVRNFPDYGRLKRAHKIVRRSFPLCDSYHDGQCRHRQGARWRSLAFSVQKAHPATPGPTPVAAQISPGHMTATVKCHS